MSDPSAESAQIFTGSSVEKDGLDESASTNTSNTNQTKKWYRETAHRQVDFYHFIKVTTYHLKQCVM